MLLQHFTFNFNNFYFSDFCIQLIFNYFILHIFVILNLNNYVKERTKLYSNLITLFTDLLQNKCAQLYNRRTICKKKTYAVLVSF